MNRKQQIKAGLWKLIIQYSLLDKAHYAHTQFGYRGPRLIRTRFSGHFCPESKAMSGLNGIVYSEYVKLVQPVLSAIPQCL